MKRGKGRDMAAEYATVREILKPYVERAEAAEAKLAEVQEEARLNRAAAEKHYAYGEAQKERAEAAEAEVGLWMDTCRKAEEQVERLKREWPEALRRQLGSAEEVIKGLEAKLAEAQAEFLGWNEAQASGRELELEAKLADALVKADCGATTPEPCRLSPPCLTCYTVAKVAEVERLREALSEEAVNRYLTERCGWSLEWDGHDTTRTRVVSTLRCFADAALRGGGE